MITAIAIAGVLFWASNAEVPADSPRVSVAVFAPNWPAWRGTNGSGVSIEKNLPSLWSEVENVSWKTPVAGKGNSSPIVWDDQIFLTSAESSGRVRSILGFDRTTGRQLWRANWSSDAAEGTHQKNGHASASPATDGTNVFAFFGSAGVLAVDMAGREAWHRDLGEFTTVWGVASSPVLFESLLILNCDQDGENEDGPTRSFLIALNKRTGETVWRTERPEQRRSWSTPVLVSVPGSDREELVLNGGDKVWAYDPHTGEPIWSCSGMTPWVTPTIVSGNGLVYAVSGSNGPSLAIRPGGRGDVTKSHVVWRAKRGGPYIPSPIFYAGRLYMVNDGGIATCYDGESGRTVFQGRLPASNFTSSLLAADEKLYITSEEGTTFVIAAGDEWKILSTNSLGERSLATPAFSNGQILIRTERHLWCIGKKRQ